MTNQEFIEKSSNIHNMRFDYSKVEYINAKTKVIIICKKHGEFEQNPNNHLNGKGCFECACDYKRSNKIDFINKSIKIHNDKYDYSFIEYIKVTSKVKIICKIHGEFLQTPNYHLSGKGCPRCCKAIKIMDTEEFLIRANLRHNDRYDYSCAKYINSRENINIICKIHGVFSQIPRNHLIGNGCPKCGTLYGVKENKWLDSFNCINRQIKIDRYIVDGYDPLSKTIYEFNGDFWHGNPKKYKPNDINTINGKRFGDLWKMTMDKKESLEKLGYNVISIWESVFDNRKI